MGSYNFAESRKQAEDAGLLGSGDYFKIQNGPNRIRLMSECVPHPGSFNGKPNFKWLCYVIDRKDGTVKPFFMPNRIYKQIEAFQLDDDYAFTDVPMPYDITITATKAGTIDAEYTVVPKPPTKLTHDDLDAFKALKPIAELQKALKEKNESKKDEKEVLYDNEGRPIPF